MSKIVSIFLYSMLLGFMYSCSQQKEENHDQSIGKTMDAVITRIYQEVPESKYQAIDDAFILNFLTQNEKYVLATKYQYFRVNVPVTVSLMRDTRQPIVPFWLESSGFTRTGDIVRNDEYEYEVWQKDFDTGWVELGINGFDMHRTVYFICVGPKNPGDSLTITDHYPSQYPIMSMEEGAFTYHDWSTLLIREFPEELHGQALFTTVRGRAREAHVRGAFRATPFVSSKQPDQLMLTWSGDPSNSIDIQWRFASSIEDGSVKYWQEGKPDTSFAYASKYEMEDRMLYNDRYIHRFTAHLDNLKSGASYEYIAGSENENAWSEVRSFQTPQKKQDKFSFIWFGDTHRSTAWGGLLQKADERHPETAFYSIAGDLVSTGLYRNEWDELFQYSGNVFSIKPLMPVLGNHDRQDGLGSWMYYELFALPEHSPEKVHPESTYAFEYGNALFLMLDATHSIEDQSEWIEEKLKQSTATWKFAMFHFPPYNFEEPYPDIQAAWCPLFDKYHVDMVMGGHVHYYMRSKPVRNGKVVSTFEEGTVYAISVGVESDHDDIGEEAYAEKRYKDGPFYQLMEINNTTLTYTAYNEEGHIKDQFSIDKQHKNE